MKEMIKKLQKRSNKKGFTLVEIIVVLVILAILAAIAVPSVLGYVNDAKDSQYISEARSAYIVVQTEEAKYRAENDLDKTSTPDLSKATVNNATVNFYTANIYGTDGTINTLCDKIKNQTGLDVKSVTRRTAGDGYEIKWNSGEKGITAIVKTNKDVTITKGDKIS